MHCFFWVSSSWVISVWEVLRQDPYPGTAGVMRYWLSGHTLLGRW